MAVPGVTLLDLLAVLEPLDLGGGLVDLALELQFPLGLALLVLEAVAEPELRVRGYSTERDTIENCKKKLFQKLHK